MNLKNIKYYFLFFLIIIPLTLLSKENKSGIHINDTIEWNNPDSFHNDSLFINNQIKYDQFYDSLITKASKNKITKTALDLLLINQPTSGKFIGIEDLRNEEYYRLYSGKKIRNIEIVKLDVFGPDFKDTTTTTTSWINRIWE